MSEGSNNYRLWKKRAKKAEAVVKDLSDELISTREELAAKGREVNRLETAAVCETCKDTGIKVTGAGSYKATFEQCDKCKPVNPPTARNEVKYGPIDLIIRQCHECGKSLYTKDCPDCKGDNQ